MDYHQQNSAGSIHVADRRPLKTRQAPWALALARMLAKSRVQPNAISMLSIVFGAAAGAAILFSGQVFYPYRPVLLVAAAACVQLRLLCNMLDGMVAIEGGLQTKSGAVFNDLPDRLSDAFILVPMGYATYSLPAGAALGWLAALLALFTAYIRMLGGASGLPQDFSGPMAKPHRMAVVTVVCLASIFEGARVKHGSFLWMGLVVIVIGCLITICRRTAHILRKLEES